MKQTAKFKICPKLTLDTMPFVQWLALGFEIYDYKRLSMYQLNNYWLYYRSHMVSCGLLYEPAHKFGLWG